MVLGITVNPDVVLAALLQLIILCSQIFYADTLSYEKICVLFNCPRILLVRFSKAKAAMGKYALLPN